MNIQDPGQVESFRNLFQNQYPRLHESFDAVLNELEEEHRTEVSLSDFKQRTREKTELYRTELQDAVTASEQEILVSDLVSDEIDDE